MAVNINVPSQVKTYANLAAFPATGALKTIYIAEDTNKTYRWTGSVYVEISASAAMTWGAIGGTLSNQTDLQNALDAKVPTSRTLTINGVTQDLSTDRTFTISTGITVGTTPISSGTIGRVLFQGTGNVLQQSSSLFWDSTNNRLGIGTSTPSFPLDVVGASRISGTLTTGGGTPLVLTGESFAFQTVVASGAGGSVFGTNSANPSFIDILSGSNFWHISNRSTTMGNRLGFFNANFTGTTATYTNELFTINTNGNIGINTTFDAGFRLDVNGTARVQGALRMATEVWNGFGTYGMANFSGSLYFKTNGIISFQTSNGIDRILMFSSGNVGINTTTDAGFRLDVNGTARVSGASTFNNNMSLTYNWTGATQLGITNTTSAAFASSQVVLTSNTTSGLCSFGKASSAFTAIKIISANDFYLYNDTTAGDISILNNFATGQIRMAAGGSSTAQMTLKSSGVLNLSSVPTSSAGLSAGDIWNDAGTLKIV